MRQFRAYCNTSSAEGNQHNWEGYYKTYDAADFALYNHRRRGKHTNNTSKYGIDEIEVNVLNTRALKVKRAKK